MNNNNTFYLFKIFLRFWLVKITRIIHHNQLLLTKFGLILRYWTDDVNLAAKLTEYRVFSLTWPASMLIYWNKRKRLHKKKVQLPQDWFGTPTWPPFHCFGTPIWPPWRHVKTLYWTVNRKDLEQVKFVLVVSTKWRNILLVSRRTIV